MKLKFSSSTKTPRGCTASELRRGDELFLRLFTLFSPNKTEFIKAKYQMLAYVHRMPCREDDSVTAKDLSKVRTCLCGNVFIFFYFLFIMIGNTIWARILNMNLSVFLLGTLSESLNNGSFLGSLKAAIISAGQHVAPHGCDFCVFVLYKQHQNSTGTCQSPFSNSTPAFGPGTWRPVWGSYHWARRLTSSTRWVTKKKNVRLFFISRDMRIIRTLPQHCVFFVVVFCCFAGQKEKGNTPLHIAAKAGQMLQAELLAVYGADPGALDSSGKTPIDYARWR